MTPSHRVHAILCTSTPPPRKGAGAVRRWAFGYAAVAELLGVSERTARALVRSGKVDPRKLESLCFAWARRQGWAA